MKMEWFIRRQIRRLRFFIRMKRYDLRFFLMERRARKRPYEVELERRVRRLVEGFNSVPCSEPLTCTAEDERHLGCLKVLRLVLEVNADEYSSSESEPIFPERLEGLVLEVLAAKSRKEVA